MQDRVRTIFFGSGTFGLPTLAKLAASDRLELAAVVTAPARRAGRKGVLRPTAVADAASQLAVDVFTPPSLRTVESLDMLADLEVDLIVLADYGRLVPSAILDLPEHGALNLHPSLLPRYRGAAPIPGAILAGDSTTGVTLMRMDEGLDTGPVIAQAELELDGDEVAPQLEASLASLGADLFEDSISAWLDGSLRATPQASDGVSLTRPLRRSDGRLDPEQSAAQLERQVRAYQPWPGSFIEVDGERLIVWAAGVDEAAPAEIEAAVAEAAEAKSRASDDARKTIVPTGTTLSLVTANGLLRLDEVQPAGKRRMSGAEFRRGRRL